MEYVEILAMILNSDDKLTKEYCNAIQNINTQFFIDRSMISDEPCFKNTGNGFIAIYEQEGEIVLEYMFNGTGTFKSCTKKVKFEFNTNLKEDLEYLKHDRITDNITDDVFDYSQFCVACTMYDLKRDTVDFNHVIETSKYTVDYYLRKKQNNEYFLQSDLIFSKPIVKNGISLNKINLLFAIDECSQRALQFYTKSPNQNEDDDEYEDDHDEYDSEFDNADYPDIDPDDLFRY